MKRPYFTLAMLTCSLAVTACNFNASLAPLNTTASSSSAAVDRFKFFINGKKTSSLSDDRKTITLSIDAVDPDGGQVKVDWSQDKDFGSFSSTRGSDVQWTLKRDGTYTVAVTAAVTGSKKTGDPDSASFLIPVEDGKIKATEMAPEITIAPQSLVLFRALPSSLSLSSDTLTSLGVKTKAQLTATTYIYNQQSSTKEKQSGDFKELKWSSTDSSVVTVDDNGYVTPADGSAVGTALVVGSSKTNSASNASAQVSVQYLDTAITLSYPTTTIYLNGQGSPNTVAIGATVKYSNPQDRGRIIYSDPNGREISWSSSNPSIVQVDSYGRVTPLADALAGDVVITATSNYDPSKSSSVTIHVRGNSQSNVTMVAQ